MYAQSDTNWQTHIGTNVYIQETHKLKKNLQDLNLLSIGQIVLYVRQYYIKSS